MRAVSAVLALFFSVSGAAFAQERCDCSAAQRSAACEASVQHREGVVAVSSSSPACSMVVWTADGQPNVTLVKDGLDIFDWYGNPSPMLSIERCEICLDRQLGLGGADAAVDVSSIRPETGIDFTGAPSRPATAPAASPSSALSGAAPQTAQRAPAAQPTPVQPVAQAENCPGGSPAPELIVPAALDYPTAMERYAMDGTCQVLFDIAETGAAMNIRPDCSHDGFTKEAARAVAVVRFSPPYHCGKPVVRKDVVYPLVFRFSARNRPTPSMAPIPDQVGN